MAAERHIKVTTAFLLITLQFTTAIPAKANSHPVIEIINEQARIDEKPRSHGYLPYGNPLAGNSKQNVRLHAQNQQAMFNAERVRQQRAQFQRWHKAPQQEDSYMKAYHESQENHQLALEQQQAKLRELKAVTIAPKLRQAPQIKKVKDTSKITKSDAVIKGDRVRSRDSARSGGRNHRSYGSVEYQQYLDPKRYRTLYVSPGPTYDQGVTIKPNGNVGIASLKSSQNREEHKLYTQAVPSKTQYIYPKHYGQMQSYQSAYDIDTLNSLLKKNPAEQLTELSELLGKHSEPSTLETPIDLYFYLKDNPTASLPQQYDESKYAQISPNYASAYAHDIKDHTPITEEVDDVEDPNKSRPKPYIIKTLMSTQVPEDTIETTTTKSNNYYKVEVASQSISAPYIPKASYNTQGAKSSYQALLYHPEQSYVKHTKFGDGNQQKGIQHLSVDGTGVSAFGDDDVSICNSTSNSVLEICNKVRKPRSALETDPFFTPNRPKSITESPVSIKTRTSLNVNKTQPTADSLRSSTYILNPKRKTEISTFLTTPNFPIGVASEYFGDTDYDSFRPVKSLRRPNRYNPAKYDSYDADDDEEEEYEDEEYDSEYDRPIRPQHFDNKYNQFERPSLYNNRPFENYAPNVAYNQNQNVDLKGSFSKKNRNFNNPNSNRNFNGFDYPQYSAQNSYQDSYLPDTQAFAEPHAYGPPKPQIYGPPKPTATPIVPLQYGQPIQSSNIIEPVYMLTQSQLKDLIGDHNLNIQHYDIYQVAKPNKKPHFPRKHKKRNRGRRGGIKHRNLKKHFSRVHKYHY